MKKILLAVLTMALISAGALAGEMRERDLVLTPEGVLYRVQTAYNPAAEYGRSSRYLTMTVQHGDGVATAAVPGSLVGGAHSNPALGYDPDSQTLFLFWQESLNGGLSSRLLFASYQMGRWSEPQALDSVDWNLRRNLRIAVTRVAETVEKDGRRLPVSQLIVHAVWWEETGAGEGARYAMLGIDNGIVTSTDIRNLGEFAGLGAGASQSYAKNSDEVLRYPVVSATPGRDSVDVIFGDAKSNSLRRIRIKPVIDGRVRIPIGVRDTNLRGVDLNVASNGGASAVMSEEDVALYTVLRNSVQYVIFRDGAWTKQRSIALNDEVSAETAIDALRRMMAEQ